MKVFPRPPKLQFIVSFLSALLFIVEAVPKVSAQTQAGRKPDDTGSPTSVLRLERIPIESGAELLTIFGKLNRSAGQNTQESEIPLVSVLRDTLGDQRPENDRLRYVWAFPYRSPTLKQRAAASIPFFYNRSGNNKSPGTNVPSPILDLGSSEKAVWRHLFWDAFQTILFDSQGFTIKASTQTYRRNADDYKKAHTIRALAILSLLESEADGHVLSETEQREIQARLMLTEKTFGGLVDDQYLEEVYKKESRQTLDFRGQNWELLRQRTEAEGLYFQPLTLPDGSATHALVWVTRSDLETNSARHFNSRFLNIKNPWRDDRLHHWPGYYETWYFDKEKRVLDSTTPGAHAETMIPLALYGLDHPRIPILLVDFRDGYNAKKREVSRRILEDIARNVLSLSRFGNPNYMLVKGLFDFTTRRWGTDLNQPSRIRAYSQLKLLLSLNDSMNPELRTEIGKQVERVSLNPFENDVDTEIQFARQQYEALVAYAQQPDGLSARIVRDRNEEAISSVHGRTTHGFFQVAKYMSLGLYTHHEAETPEIVAGIDLKRSLAYHTAFLRDVAKSSPQVEINYDADEVRRSLYFIREHASVSDSNTARVVAKVFTRTKDDNLRDTVLSCLYQIDNATAKNELLRIYQDQNMDPQWRKLSGDYLRLAMKEQRRISPSDIKVIMQISVNE